VCREANILSDLEGAVLVYELGHDIQQMAVLRLDLWLVASLKKEELTMTRSLLPLPDYFHQDQYLSCRNSWLETSPDRC
jgi:hypothetical protein